MTTTRKFPHILNQELAAKYGVDWKNERKKQGRLANKLTMDAVERICKNLRILLPLRTAFWMEGINTYSQEAFFKAVDREPYKWAMEQFQQAMAEGEALVMAKMSDPDTSDKERKRLQWLLERAVPADTYTPRTKTTKTVNENKTVSVTMKVNGGVNKALPSAPVLDAEVVKALPEPLPFPEKKAQ